MKFPTPAIEDLFEDIVGKASRGLGLSIPSPLPTDEKSVRSLAERLGLNADALWESACGSYSPAPPADIDGLAMFITSYGDMLVNSYVIFDPITREAAAFDTGSDCSEMLSMDVRITKVFLTHTHGDHIFDLDRLLEKTGAEAFLSAREPLEGATPCADGTVFSIGSLRVAMRRSSGHAAGGTTFLIEGLERPVAIVGDAVFAGSMGGTKSTPAYKEALETNRESIFSLPPETILCAGHGPLTTVAEEKVHNPFFVG
jgi:hydroxyacylglutathione hydrolase